MVNHKIIAVITMVMVFSMTVSVGCDLVVGKKSGVSSMSNSKFSSTQNLTVTSSQQTDSFHESSATNDPADIAAYFKDAEKYVLGDRTYYLDKRERYIAGGETGYLLYYRDNGKGTDISLNILASSIVTYGEHLYILTSKNDNYVSENPTDDTVYQIDRNGSRIFICNGDYHNMMEHALHKENNSLYFVRFNDNAVFKTDLNCEKIQRIPINLPGQAKIFAELKITEHGNLFSQYEVDEIKNGCLFFDYSIVNEKNRPFYYSGYKMSLTDHQVIEEFSRFEDYRQRVGDYIYYLDLNHPIKTEDEDLYEIHRIKSDGNGDVNLKIQCFRFDYTENYIFADADLSYGDFGHWYTYRYNPDGSDKQKLPYGDMFRYYDSGSLYFTENWDNTLYIADGACNVLEQVMVAVPDEAALRKKLGSLYYLITVLVTDKDGDWLNFDYYVGDPGGRYYRGAYRFNLVSKKVEKISGEYTLPKDYVPESTDSQSK